MLLVVVVAIPTRRNMFWIIVFFLYRMSNTFVVNFKGKFMLCIEVMHFLLLIMKRLMYRLVSIRLVRERERERETEEERERQRLTFCP